MNLPVSVDIERLVLGGALTDSGFMDSARASLDASDFSLDRHQQIWHAACKLYDSGGAVDRITVYSALRDAGTVERCGGISYIVSLDDGIPHIPNFQNYLTILRDKTLRRRMILAAQKLAVRAGDESESADDVLQSFAAVSTDLATDASDKRRPVSSHDLIATEGITSLLEPRRHHGIELPWVKLDKDMSGLGPGQMVVLMAATSRGKTSMALQVATGAAKQGRTPVIWTMEMSPKSLFRRMLTQLSGVYTGKQRLTLDEREAQRGAVARLDEQPIYFDRHSRSIGSFVSSLRQVRAQSGLGIAIVDYLQLIRGNGKNRAQEVSDNSRALKLAAMDFNIPFLVLSQVDRGSVKGDGAKIGIHSGKESGDIENDADVLLWIEGGELSRDHDTPISVHVGKQREGPAGFSVPMIFRPESQTFMEVADAND